MGEVINNSLYKKKYSIKDKENKLKDFFYSKDVDGEDEFQEYHKDTEKDIPKVIKGIEVLLVEDIWSLLKTHLEIFQTSIYATHLIKDNEIIKPNDNSLKNP